MYKRQTLRGGVPTEAWISFFRRSGSAGDDGEASFVVSGADDGLMKGWDLRVGGGACGASPAFVCKEHGAGGNGGAVAPHPPAHLRQVRLPVHAAFGVGKLCTNAVSPDSMLVEQTSSTAGSGPEMLLWLLQFCSTTMYPSPIMDV